MKKQRFIVFCLTIFLLSNTAFAAEINKNFNIFGKDVSSPSEAAESAARRTINKTAMKAQISSIQAKIDSTVYIYAAAVSNLANNILPEEQLKKFNEVRSNANNKNTSKTAINVEITEDGSARLSKFLNSYSSKGTFDKLTLAQRAAVKIDLLNLKGVSGSYSQIIEQAKSLTQQIKEDPVSALELKNDITDLAKTQINVKRQSKSVNKLIDNLIKSAEKEGYSL